MGSRLRPLLIVAVAMAVTAAVLLLVVKYLLMPMRFHPLPGAVVFITPHIHYGALYCYDNFVIIPGSSMVVLYYHVHGNATINDVTIYMAFPASIINETLTAFSKLSNSNDALIMGVYVNGRLIASTNDLGPILGLKFMVNSLKVKHANFAVGYTYDDVSLPSINLTSSDTLTIVIYSAVPYALPSCLVTNESSETELMVKNNWIGSLYEEGSYITEEPVIYIINATSPISRLPQELPQELLANARPLATGYAPSFMMVYIQPPQHVRIQVPSSG